MSEYYDEDFALGVASVIARAFGHELVPIKKEEEKIEIEQCVLELGDESFEQLIEHANRLIKFIDEYDNNDEAIKTAVARSLRSVKDERFKALDKNDDANRWLEHSVISRAKTDIWKDETIKLKTEYAEIRQQLSLVMEEIDNRILKEVIDRAEKQEGVSFQDATFKWLENRVR